MPTTGTNNDKTILLQWRISILEYEFEITKSRWYITLKQLLEKNSQQHK
jgi:hypothetical protein